MPWRRATAGRRQVAVMLQDIANERVDACGTHAARLHDAYTLALCANYGRDEIVYVRDDKPLQIWRVHAAPFATVPA